MPLTSQAACRVAREAASQQAFEPAARALSCDWSEDHPLHPEEIRRWAEALGDSAVAERDAEVLAYAKGQRPACPPNAVALLVLGMDGGRWQGREKDSESQSRWHEQKVLSASSYLPGDGKDPDAGGRKPQKLVTTHVATTESSERFGPLARVEAERRGLRQATEVIAMGDGGNWIDPQLEEHFRVSARIIDWFHAAEHLWDCAKALHGPQTPAASQMGERLEALLWDGRLPQLIAELTAESDKLGPPTDTDTAASPRKVLATNVGYFTRHQTHMNYPEYRQRGWPIGSGETEAAVKQFNKRIKGTEQFWSKDGVEAIIALRALWISQDQRWDRYWENRKAYVN